MTQKICRIINGRFSWFLEVDGQKIPFNYGSSADYFKKHYEELGYYVEMIAEC